MIMSDLLLHEDNIEPQNFSVALQSFTTKHSFRTYGKKEPVTYEFTQDRGLIHQYHLLYEMMYRRSFKGSNHNSYYNDKEDFHDKISHILIARRGRLCLGGCRLTIREADEAWDLPVESAGFKFREHFPALPLNQVRHAEISRFAIMEDSGHDDIHDKLCKAILEKATGDNIHYLFVMSPYHLAKNWLTIASSFGIKTTQITDAIHAVDKMPGSEMSGQLTLSDLTDFCTDGVSFTANAEILAD